MTEIIEQVMGPGKGGSILVRTGTNNADREGTTAIAKTYRNQLKRTKPAGYHFDRDSTRDRKKEPWIQELDEDGDQQTSAAAM